MRSSSCSRSAWIPLLVLWLLALPGQAQQFRRSVGVASVLPPGPVELKAGQKLVVPLKVAIRPGYHINSNEPAEDYLIPTRLTWEESSLKTLSIEYPKAEIVNYDFAAKPLSVYSGTIEIRSVWAVPDPLPAGLKELTGKLRYQACNDKACLPPVTADVTLPVSN
jgi:hypothetical protein